MKKLSTEEFIDKANKIHNNKYDYSLTKYINNKAKIIIICPKHGRFEQIPSSHLSGNGCPCCSHKIPTNSDFIDKANKIHNNKYDYSLTNYINSYTKIKIICHKHGIFEQKPNDHLNGHGCPKCSKLHKLTTEEFIERAEKCHSIKYDYGLTEYINRDSKVKIICPIHGLFEQRAATHLLGCNCPKCAKHNAIYKNNKLNTVPKTTGQFIKEAKNTHGDKYDYSLVKYINKNTPVDIICPRHGTFRQKPRIHLSGCGCPHCNESKGEKEIKLFLESRNIDYEYQKKFDDLKDKLPLSYDFYIPSKNLLIEYNGIQHYKKSFGRTDEYFKLQLKHDKLKKEYALNNNINLLVISFKDDIQKKLSSI